jgi:hypothetical protein
LALKRDQRRVKLLVQAITLFVSGDGLAIRLDLLLKGYGLRHGGARSG